MLINNLSAVNSGYEAHVSIMLSGEENALGKMHALTKKAFKYHGNGTLSSKSILLFVYVCTYCKLIFQ